MVETALSVASLAAQHLGRLAIDEAKYLYGVKSKVEELHDEIKWMQVFLEDADTILLNKSKSIELWTSKIYDFSYEAEDTMDKYIHGVFLKRRDGMLNTLKWGRYMIFNIKNAITLHEVGSEIDALTQKIAGLNLRLQTYKIKSKSGEGKPSSPALLKMKPAQYCQTLQSLHGRIFSGYLSSIEASNLLKKETVLEENCPDYSEKKRLLAEMLPECNILSQVVVMLGRTLSTLEDVRDWQTVKERITAENCESDICEVIYWAVPNQLKPLLLYLGMFPKWYSVRPNRLYGWWAAEGMIAARQGQTAEALAEKYLYELVYRGVVTAEPGDDKRTYVILPDPMREICVEKARKNNFLKIVSSDDDSIAAWSHDDDDDSKYADPSRSTGSSTSIRRLAIYMDKTLGDYCAHNHADVVFCNAPYLRTLFLYGVNGCEVGRVKELIKRLSRSYPSLRVLSLSIKTPERRLSKKIGALIHLRVLSLKGCVFQNGCELPSTIGNLRSLQTLDLRAGKESKIIIIPNVFPALKQLIHLYFPEDHKAGRSEKFQLEDLIHLKVLKNLDLRQCREQNFLKLKGLRRVLIQGPVAKKDSSKLESLLAHPRIRSGRLRKPLELHIGGDVFTEYPTLLSGCSKSLGILKIQLTIPATIPSTVLQSLKSLGSLYSLGLEGAQLREDSLWLLGRLPELRILALRSCSYCAEDGVWSIADGFPRLRDLKISGLSKLEQCRVEEGALPNLEEKLVIEHCSDLKKITGGFPNLNFLWLNSLPELGEVTVVGRMPGRLEHIRINDCPNLKTVPDGLSPSTVVFWDGAPRYGSPPSVSKQEDDLGTDGDDKKQKTSMGSPGLRLQDLSKNFTCMNDFLKELFTFFICMMIMMMMMHSCVMRG